MILNEIFVLTLVSSIILVLLLFLLFYLLIRKAIENKKRKQIDSYKEKMNPQMFSYLVDGEITTGFQTDTIVKKQALEELLNHYADVIEGEDVSKNVTLLAHQHLTNFYRDSLKSIRWSRRMNALYHIEDFQMYLMKEDIEAIIKEAKSKDEVVIALRILASFHSETVVELLLNSGISLEENDYRTILFRLDRSQLDPFVHNFHHCSEPLQFALIEVISLKKEFTYVAFLETIFASEVGEVRLRALKAIAAIGYVSTIQPYVPLFESSVWQERMMVAKLSGSLKDRQFLPQLRKLLADSSWWVRFQAGQSIMMFPDGKDILANMFETTEDPFVRDMALEWMNKGAM